MRHGKIWIVFTLAVVACTGGDTIVGTPSFDVPDASLPTGVHARLVSGPYAAGRQTVYVVLQAREVDFSSYQGVLDFDHKTLQLLSISVPDTDTHLLNRAEAPNGRIPIAGFATDGFNEPIPIILSFATPRALRTGDLDVTLDVVGTSVGAEVPARLLFQSNELLPGNAR